MEISITRKSLPQLLREAGCPGEYRYSKTAGAMRVVLPDGEELTPGQAAERYLPPCKTCGKVWPLCGHQDEPIIGGRKSPHGPDSAE